LSEEEKLDPIEFGFTTDGKYLKIKVPVALGMWNILGALAEAHIRVMNYFSQMATAEAKKQNHLIRPNGHGPSMNQWK
jgi:hypothetical protein